MKRFEFSLERMLKVKKQLERLAEMEQARAQKAVNDSHEVVQLLHARLQEVAGQMQGRVGQALAAGQWLAVYEMSDHIGRQIELAEQAVRVAEQNLREATSQRTTASREVKALSTLRQQQWEQWQREAATKDQERLDELGLRRWMQAQADREKVANS